MIKAIFSILCSWILSLNFVYAQKTYSFNFHSDILNENRTIRIHLPKSYTEEDSTKYPLLLSFDGEYLFYSIMGTSENLSFREIIPETVIVGIDQNKEEKDGYPQRWYDCDYDYGTSKLKDKGLKFMAFIQNELIPYINNNYKIGTFYSIAGHSLTANYINYFLDDTRFKGFISISPYIPESIEDNIKNTLTVSSKMTYYFICTGSNDLSGHIPQIKKQDSLLFSQIHNDKFNYLLKDYMNENHMSLVTRSMVDALTHIYSGYAPIYTLGIDSVLIKEPNLLTYLFDRYENIKYTYGINIPIREDDLTYISWLIEEQENWDELKEIGDLTIKILPNSVYGYYMLGLSQEKKNNLQSALDSYKMGYSKLGNNITNKEQFYDDIKRIENLLRKK